MLNINSIANGIVIDHISPGNGHNIYTMLELDKVDCTVALIKNAHSKKYGRKDMIKIENILDINLDALGLLDSRITVIYIENEKIQEKIQMSLPKVVVNILKCRNPRCITTSERVIDSKFSMIDEEKVLYKCDYCDKFYNVED